MRLKFILIPLILLASAPIWAAAELSGTPEELVQYLSHMPQKMVISASAKERVVLDKINLTLDIKTESSSMSKALEDHDKLRKRTMEELLKKGILETQIKAKAFSAVPRPRWIGKTLVVESKLSVEVSSAKELASIAEVIEKNQELRLGDVHQEELPKQSQYERAALDKALIDLQSKVELYEKRLSITLVPITVVNEQVYLEAPAPEMRMAKASLMAQDAASSEEAAPADPGFGEKTFQAFVSVEFRVLNSSVKTQSK